jgi:hypothetical protein
VQSSAGKPEGANFPPAFISLGTASARIAPSPHQSTVSKRQTLP